MHPGGSPPRAQGGGRSLLPLVGHLPQAAQPPGLLPAATRQAAGPPGAGPPARERGETRETLGERGRRWGRGERPERRTPTSVREPIPDDTTTGQRSAGN